MSIKRIEESVKFQLNIYSGYVELRTGQKAVCPDYTWEVDEETGECYKVPRKKRGKIKGFSKASRKRLLNSLYSLSELPSYFITLTYPKDYPLTSRKWKRDLNVFDKALRRVFPGYWFYWKLEPQKRGAPHFHLLGSFGPMGDKKNFRILCRWLSETWFRIVGSNDIKHLRAGTNIKRVEGKRAIRIYLSKYTGKQFTLQDLPECWGEPGRFWGIIGRKNVPVKKVCHVVLGAKEFYNVRRFLSRWLRSIARKRGKVNGYVKRIKKLLACSVYIDSDIIIKYLSYLGKVKDIWIYYGGEFVGASADMLGFFIDIVGSFFTQEPAPF